MNTDKRVLVDLDCVGADLWERWLGIWNAENEEFVRVADLRVWKMPDDRMYEILRRPGFFASLRPLPGFIAAMWKMQHDMGLEVIVASAADSPIAAKEKIEWCAEYIPFIDRKNIFLGCKKYILEADVMIDDGPHNLIEYRANHSEALLIGPRHPYNEGLLLAPELSDDPNFRIIDGWWCMDRFWEKAMSELELYLSEADRAHV